MKKILLAAVLATTLPSGASQAQDCFLGEIRLFAGNFTPRNYMKAEGQLLSISQNTALFSILGTMYGGDGRTTFALPDMRAPQNSHSGSMPTNKPRTPNNYIICTMGIFPSRQ